MKNKFKVNICMKSGQRYEVYTDKTTIEETLKDFIPIYKVEEKWTYVELVEPIEHRTKIIIKGSEIEAVLFG